MLRKSDLEDSPEAPVKEVSKESKRDKLEISDAGTIVESATSDEQATRIETFQDMQKEKGATVHKLAGNVLADSKSASQV